jgi:hypothetical protein
VLSVAVALAVTLAAASGCGGGGSSGGGGTSARPRTNARIQIVEPTANQVTGRDPTLKVNLIGAKVVDRTTGPINPEEGHIHVKVDGNLVSMAFGTTQDLHGLAPGPHTLQAEFVATDHAPFANPVVAAALFTVAL